MGSVQRHIEHFESLDFIKVDGQVVSFQGSLQLNIKRIRRVQEMEYNKADYLPTSQHSVEDMYKELLGYIRGIHQPHLKILAEMLFVQDKEFIKSFINHSAAKTVHHSFVGGLLNIR